MWVMFMWWIVMRTSLVSVRLVQTERGVGGASIHLAWIYYYNVIFWFSTEMFIYTFLMCGKIPTKNKIHKSPSDFFLSCAPPSYSSWKHHTLGIPVLTDSCIYWLRYFTQIHWVNSNLTLGMMFSWKNIQVVLLNCMF